MIQIMEEVLHTDSCGTQLSGVCGPTSSKEEVDKNQERGTQRPGHQQPYRMCWQCDVSPGGQGKPRWLRKRVRALRTNDSGMIWNALAIQWLRLPAHCSRYAQSLVGELS